MNWNDLEVMWRRQPVPERTDADLSELRATFEAKRRKTKLIVQLRNGSEAGAGMVVIIFIGRQIWKLGSVAWPLYISLAFILGITARFALDYWRAYRIRLGPEATVLAKIDAEIAELRHQRRFLAHWETWYLLPCLGILVTGFWGISRAKRDAFAADFVRMLFTTPATLTFIIAMVGFIAFALVLAARSVRRTISKNITPRI